MARKIVTLIDRLMKYISTEPNSGCWLWTGCLSGNGYAQIGLGSRSAGVAPAHRVSYELHVGPIPEGLDLDHLCRVHCCVNPAHLEPVTRKENLLRGDRGAGTAASVAARKAEKACRKGHAYPENQLEAAEHRHCPTCASMWVRAHRELRNARKRQKRQDAKIVPREQEFLLSDPSDYAIGG